MTLLLAATATLAGVAGQLPVTNFQLLRQSTLTLAQGVHGAGITPGGISPGGQS